MTSLSKITGQEGTTLALLAGESHDIKAWTLLAFLQPQPHSRVMKRGLFVIGRGLTLASPRNAKSENLDLKHLNLKKN